uniref:SMB domain-containing protein n=1 Tax=Aceria tosichella TaxID=561515 RepID=A0A6G1SCA2_9ACAR
MKMMTMTMIRTMTIIPRHCACFLQFASILLTLGLIYLLQIDLISALGSIKSEPHHAMNNTSRNGTVSSRLSPRPPQSPPLVQPLPQPPQVQLGDRCVQKGSCRSRAASSSSASATGHLDLLGLDRPACHCDQNCQLYDDCCQDSRWAEAASKRVEMGPARLRARRREWLCRRVDPAMADVYLRASCHPDWVRKQKNNATAELVRQRCELAGAPRDSLGPSEADWLHSDPLGTLMPITDLTEGITYANSYCLRCNSFGATRSTAAAVPAAVPTNSATNLTSQQAPRKLIYWSPLVSCNYNLDSDDRNALYDLISTKGGRALAYSRRHNKWFVKMTQPTNSTSGANHTTTAIESDDGLNMDRLCSVSPRIPDSVISTIRRCRPRTVDACPVTSNLRRMDGSNNNETTLLTGTSTTMSELERAQYECQFGHQSLVYSQTRDLAYYNPACARCNLESQVSCEPRLDKQQLDNLPSQGKRPLAYNNRQHHAYGPRTNSSLAKQNTALASPPEPIILSLPNPIKQPVDTQLTDTQLTDITTAGRNQGGFQPVDESDFNRAPVSGSFSVLMDLYGGLQGDDSDEQVGSVHRCEDADRQVYDPFLLTCRDIVCGLSYRFEDGACVQLEEVVGVGSGIAEPAGLSMDATNATSSPNELEAATTATASTEAAVARVNGSTSTTTTTIITGDKRSSSSGQRPTSERLVVQSQGSVASSGQEEQQQQPQQVSSIGQRVEREERRNEHDKQVDTMTPASDNGPATTLAPASAGEALARLPQSSSESGQHQTTDASSTSNPFLALFSELVKAQPMASSLSVEANRKSFAECGKILIQPEHYRLFDMSELNASLASSSLTSPESIAAEWLANRPNPHTWDQKKQRDTWALVAPYNLTLAPGQFQPVVRAAAAARQQQQQQQQLGLLVCSPFKSDLVDKFKPAMVYLTTSCLVVSITSLVLYLLLYWLSTFDLRHLVVELAQQGQIKDSLRHTGLPTTYRGSKASAETSYNAVRSQSLSSRGVACLAAALLAAYLLFVLGHHHQSPITPTTTSNSFGAGLTSCALIAAATYGSFLLSFNWMFLLSYDIWRTLRLATHHLRAPTMGSQTSRFLIYATLAAFVACSMSLLALFADQMGQSIDCQASLATTTTSTTTTPITRQSESVQMEQQAANLVNCSRPLQLDPFEQMIQTYRPKFGQRAGSCWFSNRRSLALFFGLPVTLIMLINLLFFLHSSFMVIKTSSRSSRRLKPTNSTWSQASEQTTVDFAQQNSLTTSSISSVQTIQSTISAQSDTSSSANNSLQEQRAMDKEPSSEALESAAGIQEQIDEAAREIDERKQQSVNKIHTPLGHTKQTSFNGSVGGNSQISFTDQLLASALVHKCDLHLSSLGSVMSSLAKDYRLYCRLSTIMGLTWLTGLAASLVDQSDVLWYLFVVLNSLQGLFIFVAFGLKRSRLTNLRILILHIDHKLKQKFLREDSGNRSKT